MSNEILEKPFGVPISKLNLKTFSNNHHTRTEPRLPFYQPSHIQMSVLPSLYHLFIIFSAFECGNPTSNLTEQMKSYLTKSEPAVSSLSIQIVIICESGYKFSDNSMQNPSVCGSTGKWSSTPDCTGILKSFVIIEMQERPSEKIEKLLRICEDSNIYKIYLLIFSKKEIFNPNLEIVFEN